MARLEDLKKSVLDMDREEHLELVRSIREDRKISKHAITVRKARTRKASDRIRKLFESLTPQEKEQFLTSLGDEGDEG